MLLDEKAKRCVIYFIYDKDGVIDEYIIEQLKDLRNNAQHIHCVINGNLNHDGKVALEQVADDVFVRENKGVDIGAYKAAIDYLGWDKIRTFDELVIMNNTCFGPVYPFKEVFDWAAKQDVDLWGLTWDIFSNWTNEKKYLHSHNANKFIQSYFIVFRASLLKNQFLENFFNEIPSNTDYATSGMYYEKAIPGYFEEHNFKYAVYCDTDNNFDYPLLHNPVRLLKEFRMPLFKKRSFFHHYTDILNHTAGESASELVRFLEKETNYDMSLVWKSILRTSSLSDLVRCAQLKRVLPKDYAFSSDCKLKIGVVFHAYYTDLFDETVSYLKNFPQNTDILITTSSQEKAVFFEEKLANAGVNAKVKLIENRGRDVSSLLVGAKDFVGNYDLVCFAHDKKSTQIDPASVGRSWSFKLSENMFGSKEYVLNVINLFEKESSLGIAFPSYPNHAHFGFTVENGWGANFEKTKELLKEFNVNVKINPHTLCVAPLGTCFWFRPKALEKLFAGKTSNGWSFDDFPQEKKEPVRDGSIMHAVEHAYAYFAQDAGFYPVTIYTDNYARVDLTNLEFMQVGSTKMRAWTEALASDSIGYKKLEDIFHKPVDQITDDEIISNYAPPAYSIGTALEILSQAIRRVSPRLWRLIAPMRLAAKRMYSLAFKLYTR